MNKDDAAGFKELLTAVFGMYDKSIGSPVLRIYWAALKQYSLADIQRAASMHAQDTQAGMFLPKPANFIKHIDGDSRVLDGDGDETPEVDMGADESACDDVQNDLDFNGDGIIDWDEFVMFADAWLRDTNDPNWNPHCDLNNDHHVNYVDFAFFAKEWLWQACWRASGTGVWMMMGMGGGESMLISQTATVEAVTEQQATEIQPQAEPSVEEQIEQIKGLLDWLYEAKDTIDEETWLSLVNSLEEMLKELEDSQEGD